MWLQPTALNQRLGHESHPPSHTPLRIAGPLLAKRGRGPVTVVEFPMTCSAVPHSINQEMNTGAVMGGDVVIGGDVGW